MSRVAHEFWNHKRIAQAEARQRLKALGVLTGDEVQKPIIVVDKNVPAGTIYGVNTKYLKGKPSDLQRMYEEGAR